MLAPKIILDKSTLRGIGTSQVQTLFRHFDALLPPILLREIATELSKDGENPEKIEAMARSLAQKASSSRADIVPDVDVLLYNELLYQPSKLTSKQIPQGYGIWLRAKDGSKGIFFDEAPEMDLLRRWACENFSENDFENAFQIRETHEKMVLDIPKKLKKEDSAPTLNQIVEWIDNNHLTKENQELIISSTAAYLPESKIAEAIERWNNEGRPDLTNYAPFCYYFYRLTAIYILGCQFELIGTRKEAKSHLDIQYLYYLPFCDVFATGDKELLSIAKLLIRPDQVLANTDELKKEIEILALYAKSKPPRTKTISRRPAKDCSVPIIHKSWTIFAGPESREPTFSSHIPPDKNSDKEALTKFKITQSSIIFESNKSLNPIYTEEFNKLSLSQKNLIVCEQATQSDDPIVASSKISQFFSIYADLWRPDTNLHAIFRNCSPRIPKPLWMFDGNGFSWLEQQLMLPYFNHIFAVDPVVNPWSIKHNVNPLNCPESYACFFDEVRMFYHRASEALHSRQMLVLPHIEGFEPQLAWVFGQAQQERSNSSTVTDEEKVEIEAKAYRFKKNLQHVKLNPTSNFHMAGTGTPSLETSLLLSRLTGSIPVTSSIVRRNELLNHLNRKQNCEQLAEIEHVFQNYWFKFFPEYPPFFMGKLKESGFLLEFREFLVEMLQQIKLNPVLDKKLVLELHNKLKNLDQEWETLISSETFDKNSVILKGKLSIYIGLGEFQVNEVNKALNESYHDLIEPVERSIFMMISDIAKFS